MIKDLPILELIENIQQGVTVFDNKLKLLACNKIFLDLASFPDEFSKPGTPLIDFLRYNAQRGYYGTGNSDDLADEQFRQLKERKTLSFEREVENDLVLRIERNYTKNQWLITTYSDVTASRKAVLESENISRSLDAKNLKQAQQIRAAEKERKERNKTLEIIIENTKIGITLFDKKLLLVACNIRFLELMSFPESFLIPGTSLREFLHYNAQRGEYGKGNIGEMVDERVALAQKFEAHKFERTRPNGTILEIIGTPAPEGFVTTYSDITQLRHAQFEVEKAKENLEKRVIEQTYEIQQKNDLSQQLLAAFESLKETVAMVDENDRFIFANKQYRQMNAEVGDKITPGSLFKDYLIALADQGLVPAAIGREKEWVQKRLLRHQNPRGAFELSRQNNIRLLINEQKLESGGTIMFGTDITDLARAKDALRESEERFRDFAENGADWFWELDSDLRYTNFTGRSEEVMGFKPSEVIGKSLDELFQFMQNHEPSDSWLKRTDILQKHQILTNFEVPWRRPDGHIRHISLNAKPRFKADGTFLGYRGVGRDITERIQLEEQLRRTQKMEAIGQLTGGIAHDFNNILGIIQGNMELAEEALPQNAIAHKRLTKALLGVDRAADITKKLLSFSRKDAGQTQSIIVNKYIENLEDILAKSLTASIRIETYLADNLWAVAADQGDFEDAILNLSLNARDAMPGGGILMIETENKTLNQDYVQRNPEGTAGDFVMISVSDTGNGMTEEIRSKVFEPFFTTKAQGKGTGLGLSMVYGFVQRSGGHLKIYSEIGKGSVFRIYLPRINSDTEQIEPISPLQEQLPRGGETILIVDDEDALRDIAASHLQRLGYTILTAENGQNALQVIKADKTIDLLFSDIVMPGNLDGYQLAAAAYKENPTLNILLASGFTKIQKEFSSEDNNFASSPLTPILSKPYNRSELAFAVRKALDAL
ncbi:MAG: PAS-domain containing protein [Sneathiella sp.]